MKENGNSRHVGAQQDRSFYGSLHEMSDIHGVLIMLLICVESGKIPLLLKVKQLFKCLRVGVLIDIAYIAKYKLYRMASLFLVYRL